MWARMKTAKFSDLKQFLWVLISVASRTDGRRFKHLQKRQISGEQSRKKKGYEEGSKVHTFIDELKIAPLRDEARCVVAALGIWATQTKRSSDYEFMQIDKLVGRRPLWLIAAKRWH